MTKRQQQKQARLEEAQAVEMYSKGRTLAEIKRKTGVDGYIVRGLVCAQAISRI